MGSVNITLANGQLGATLQTSDGVAGMVLTGQTETGGYTAGTPIMVTSLNDLGTQGISQTGNAFAYRQVKEYYDEAGTGAQLYLMLVPATMKVNQIADKTNANGAVKLLDFANGKIKLLGITTDDTAVYTSTPPVTTQAINADVYTAATNMASLASDYFESERPFRAVIGGTSYNGNATLLTDMTAGTTNNRTAIFMGDTQAGPNTGARLDGTSSTPVMDAVKNMLTSLPFNGLFVLNNLIATLQSIDGVRIGQVVSAQATYASLPPTPVTVEYTPDAGYLALDEAYFAINITYTPHAPF